MKKNQKQLADITNIGFDELITLASKKGAVVTQITPAIPVLIREQLGISAEKILEDIFPESEIPENATHYVRSKSLDALTKNLSGILLLYHTHYHSVIFYNIRMPRTSRQQEPYSNPKQLMLEFEPDKQ